MRSKVNNTSHHRSTRRMCEAELCFTDEQTEYVENNVLACQSQAGTRTSATRSTVVRNVHILSFPV